MNKIVRYAAIGLMTTTIAACSSSSNNDPVVADDQSTGTTTDTTTGTTTGATTGTATGTTTGTTTGATTGTATGTTTGTATGATTGTGTGTTTGATTGDTTGTATGDTTGTTTGDTTGTATGDTTGTTTGDTTGTATGDTTGTTTGTANDGPTGLGNPPELPNPFANPIAGPSATDPFGADLEIDDEAAVAGGPPSRPKNLRAELVSNDWAEINWAPSNDDGDVVEYTIYRSDGHTYTVGRDQTDANGGAQAEINKFWNTTSFIDCNYTRFLDRVHNCATNGPKAGDTFSYTVSATDNEGNESALSDPITITYHAESNAPVPFYDDFYKEPTDRFASVNDLSNVDNFIGSFTEVFGDEFNGDAIDATKWNTGLTWGDTAIINGEQQYFVNTQRDTDFGFDPFKFNGSSLLIEAIPTPEALEANLPETCNEPDPTGNERCLFLSGALSSHDLFGMTYGYVESRMKVGGESGMLSSFYLYHRYPGSVEDKTYHAPEIDIIEYLGENPFGDEDAFQTYHYGNVTDTTTMSAPTMEYKNPTGALYSDDFHTYSVLWEPQLVIWYIDGQEIKRLSGPQVGRQQMNIVAYLVAGSAWAPTPDLTADNFPLQLEIDYIRAYQRDAYNGNGLYPGR